MNSQSRLEQFAYLHEDARNGDRKVRIITGSVIWTSGKESNVGPVVRRINILAIPTAWKILKVR